MRVIAIGQNVRRRWLTIALILVAACLLADRVGPGFPRTMQLEGIEQSGSGHSYAGRLGDPGRLSRFLFTSRGDSNEIPRRSSLQLYEDAEPLPYPHSVHAEIADMGRGRYSHWVSAEPATVYFSTRDNSNPVTNGRTYTARYGLHLRGTIFAGGLMAVAVCLIWLYLTEIRRFLVRAEVETAPAILPTDEDQHWSPLKKSGFSLVALVVLATMGLGLFTVTDMAWRATHSPEGAIGFDTSFFEYRDYVVTTQPANLVLGMSKHPAEAYYSDRNCATSEGITARFNSLGFRSPEFTDLPPKPSNEIRIIITGGSASISHNVSEDCTLDVNLQRLLTREFPSKIVKIYNLGSGAWKSFQELVAIERYGIDIKPDLIIALDGFNDIAQSFKLDYHAAYAGWWMQESYARFRDWVWSGPIASFQGNKIVHDVSTMLKGRAPDPSERSGGVSSYPEFATGGAMATSLELPIDRWQIAQRVDFDPRNRNVVNLYLRNKKLLELVAEHSGSRILHVLQPILFLKEPLSAPERERLKPWEETVNYNIQGFLRMSSGLREMTRESKFARYLDLSAPFEGDSRTYFYDYCHMNAAGYRIIAARIADVATQMLQAEPR